MPNAPIPQFLGLGREPEERIDLAVDEQVLRFDLRISDPMNVSAWVEPDMSRHQSNQDVTD